MTDPEDDTALLVFCSDGTAMRSEAIHECFCGCTSDEVEPPTELPVRSPPELPVQLTFDQVAA
jgi:hypothetical protein